MSDVRNRTVPALLHVTFVLAGMATTLLGPMMPLLMTRWSLSDASAGLLFTTQFTGQTLATIGSSWLSARLGDRRAMALGLAVTATGVALLGMVPWPAGAAAALLYGLGLGIVLPLTNFVMAALRPADAAAALSLLNVSWGAGAVLWPLVVRLSTWAVPGDVAPLAVLSVLTAALAVLTAGWTAEWPSRSAMAGHGQPTEVGSGPRRGGVPTLVAGFAAASYLYVGAENGIGGWIAEFTRRTATSIGASWTLAPTAFWGAETLGRLATPLILRSRTEAQLLVAGLLASCLAVVLLVVSGGSAALLFGGAVLAGAGLAPIFPLILASMNRQLAPAAPHLMGPVFAMGGVGGATLPWVVGFTSSRTGSLESGLVVTLVALVGILAIQAAAYRSLRP